MIPRLEHYRKIVGMKSIKAIRKDAEHLRGKKVVHVNTTATGGGVAEILNTLVFLMNDLGIDTGWRILLGSHSFFKITKGMHNALQGNASWKMTDARKRIYLEYCHRNAIINHIKDKDIVIIHDPQPAGMIKDYEKKTLWLWRCHIDLSNPNPDTMQFLLPYLQGYDGVIVSSEKFKIKGLKKPHFIIPPSIDPLSVKNKKISREIAKRILARRGIDMGKPIISQVSRFDPWKGHIGVIKMYEQVRQQFDCQLVLMGDMAGDDPQGPIIYHKIKQLAERVPGIHIITEKNDLLVNALQSQSAFVFQNSVKEGFALTVSEALWKQTPVLGTAVGGIPLQVKNGETGFLINDLKDGIQKALRLLKDTELRNKLGLQGKEHVRKNFLIIRQLHDYIKAISRFYPPPNLEGLY
ncbi:MAG: glycosyltransferase [Candidatus Woesearchaeota archaeon]